jgi:hypothetical protein
MLWCQKIYEIHQLFLLIFIWDIKIIKQIIFIYSKLIGITKFIRLLQWLYLGIPIELQNIHNLHLIKDFFYKSFLLDQRNIGKEVLNNFVDILKTFLVKLPSEIQNRVVICVGVVSTFCLLDHAILFD